ncbi:RNA polymerase sigma factor SigZ [Vibrio harveyi]|jgi:RNA polymerase sigma-70 factor (ECF subfamily)|uniref:RNA polymerase sigma factor SigZ n=1 Tax=Vibrio sp. SSH13-20 TaxID=3136668 RepID=UPI0027EE1777|nr:RNA polymerase sigma factor SigZ [Vibrio harveyi]EKO3862680.1 RNA polymerase sigma factor SigZ [Vibrio harveyi]EKY4194403.1 RNA polymerase sigma factor SigZ [Vibrio harveyi]HDM8183432.1 RNA polymerase sigma factor SigZ [Vibrio harveyi]
MLAEWLTHKEQLKNYIVKQTSDPDLADDILQEVYIKASQKIDQLEARSKIKSWLYRITHNAIMDHYRTQQSYEELIDNQIEEEMPIELENLQTMGHCLRPMFECLPEKYRQAMILSELDGLPQQMVADQLGLSLSATKSRIQRGRVKLKALLVEYCNVEAGRGGIVDFSPEPQCLHMAQMYSAEVA